MSIFEYIRTQQNHYETDTVTVAGKEFNQKDRLEAIEVAAMAMYKEDDSDQILGTLTYDDVITDKVEKEAQILDFDTKHMDISPTKMSEEARMKAMIATAGTRDIMDDEEYGKFFNKWVHTYSKYGGVITKNTEEGVSVVPWHNVITDQTDILSGVIIEKHYYTPAELLAMGDVWNNVDLAVQLAEEEKQITGNDFEKESDTMGHYIEVHEIHGELRESDYKEDGDPDKYVRMFMVVAGVNAQSSEEEGEKGVVLFETEEAKNPYKYKARNPIDGVALGRGLYEELLPQQMIHNFLVNEELKMVAITNKIYIKTNKEEIPANVSNMEQLTVFQLNDNEYMEFESAQQRSLPAVRDLRQHIQDNIRNISGMHEAVMGEEGKANTPFSLERLRNMEGHSRFIPERQDIGNHFTEIVKDWTLPKALKQMRSKDELYARFSDNQLVQIDKAYMNALLNRRFTELTLEGEVMTPEIMEREVMKVESELRANGKKRGVSGLRDFLKDIQDDIRISFTNESFDKGDFFESRIGFVQLLGADHPWSRAMIRKSMDEAGITPEEIAQEEEQAPIQGTPTNVELPGNAPTNPAQQV